MKNILLIGTGGTIASDVTEDGLAPELTTEQLLSHLPAISGICNVDCVQLLNLDSTNMRPEHWLKMVRCIRESYDRYDGFVITHGTDTMAYTAAALSYLIQGSPKPIILTGAQKPIGFDSTDSKINLADAFRCAASDLPGVSIVFNSHVILGLFQHQLSRFGRSAGRCASALYPAGLPCRPGIFRHAGFQGSAFEADAGAGPRRRRLSAGAK